MVRGKSIGVQDKILRYRWTDALVEPQSYNEEFRLI